MFWFILALNFVFGAVFNLLPVTFPVFKHSFGSSLEELGRIQLLFFLAGVLFSLCGGWFVDRVGLKRAAIAALLCLAGSLAMVGSAWSFELVLVASFIFGLAVAAIAVVFSAMICEVFPERRQSLFFLSGILDGLGAVLGPTALGKWLLHAERTGASWRAGYYTSSAAVGVLLLWSMLLKSNVVLSPKPDRSGIGSAVEAMKGILKSSAIYVIGGAYLLHGLAQVGMVSWIGQLYQSTHHIDIAQAAYFISVNSVGFFVGRSLLSWLTARWHIPDLLLLAVCAGGGTLAFAATLGSNSYHWGLLAFAVAGFFVSGDGPAINSYTGLRFVGDTATAFAVLGGIGNLGAGTGPYIVGVVGSRLGLEKGIWLMPLFTLALATLAFIWFMRRKTSSTSRPVS